MRRPLWTAAGSLLIPALGFLLATTLGSQFFPRTDRDMFQVEVWLRSGSWLDRTRAPVARIEEILRTYDAVRSVHWLIGASYPSVCYSLIMDQDGSPHYAQGALITPAAPGR